MKSAVDIEALAWSSDGSVISYSSRPGRIAALDAIATEGRTGYRYDGRFRPLFSDRPLIPADVPLVDQAIDATTGDRVATPTKGVSPMSKENAWPKNSVAHAVDARNSASAWSASSGAVYRGLPRLRVRMRGREISCSWGACVNVSGLWWTIGGKDLIFQRRDGVADSRTEFYVWSPGRTAPRRLLSTTDALFGCRFVNQAFICAQETSVKPRSLVTISINDGTRRTIFDANPEYAELLSGEVRRLEWPNAYGISTFGDLVLPPGYRRDRRLPLVIVQYDSKGFLRGGTGDEYPIQALAARGFAVLSFNRPPWFALTLSPKDQHEFNKFNIRDFADRRSNLSSLEEIIQKLTDEAVIDPMKVVITGLSDGAVTATFAIANSSMFRGAILSTCCESESAFEISGTALDDFYIEGGYPATRDAGRQFWHLSSLAGATQAKIIPILIQASSAEYRMALGTYRELLHRGWPIEMFVYPNEGHVKIRPAHRKAIYDANVKWLENVTR